jgi:murein DD-endopeptidase MepM/ murein hydrolase activator NlpD
VTQVSRVLRAAAAAAAAVVVFSAAPAAATDQPATGAEVTGWLADYEDLRSRRDLLIAQRDQLDGRARTLSALFDSDLPTRRAASTRTRLDLGVETLDRRISELLSANIVYDDDPTSEPLFDEEAGAVPVVAADPAAGFELADGTLSGDTGPVYGNRVEDGGHGATGTWTHGLRNGNLSCPVPGARFINDWGFPRSGGRTHQGNDLFAPTGTPIIAPTDGVVTRVVFVDTYDPARQTGLAGLSVSMLTSAGDRWFFAHLDTIAPGIRPGVVVTREQLLGTVGRTGNARTTPPHAHTQFHPGNGPPVNPYPILAPVCLGIGV